MIRFLALALTFATPLCADPARIIGVEATPTGGLWRIDVTIEHGDTGWEDYADGWRVEDEEGTILATRILHHPHVTEQPFTRGLFRQALPDGIEVIYIRASTNLTGWGERRFELTLP